MQDGEDVKQNEGPSSFPVVEVQEQKLEEELDLQFLDTSNSIILTKI